MDNSTMKAVAVVPKKRELRVVEHPLPQISSENQSGYKLLMLGYVGLIGKSVLSFMENRRKVMSIWFLVTNL